MMPKRIQRKRTKGWKMPEGAIYVGRPTKWGNPFYHAARFVGIETALSCYKECAEGIFDPSHFKTMPDGPFHVACVDAEDWIAQFRDGPAEEIKRELRGKDLACWCAADQPCHADVLLEIANA